MASTVRKAGKKVLFDVDENLDTAYIGLPTDKYAIGVDIDEDIMAHLDIRQNKIIGFTITHWNRFKEKVYLKKRAQENVQIINNYVLKHYPRISIPTPLLTNRKRSDSTFSHF